MNDHVTISAYQVFGLFPNEEAARKYLEERRWPSGTTCPACNNAGHVTPRNHGFYRCNPCKLDFTVRTGTIFERSHVPLHKWLYAMYLLVTARKGISSLQLSKEIGITQKSAWFVLHRLREACGAKMETLQGTVEVDETFIGGLEENKHMHDRVKKGVAEKFPVIGLRQRGGNTLARVLESAGGLAISSVIEQNVEPGSRLMGDENASYAQLTTIYNLQTVRHGVNEYVRGDIHNNGVESVWALLRRGLHGVYHKASRKHLGRYLNEFAFRLNAGNVTRHTLERLDSLVLGVVGKRITYADLTA